MGYFKLKNMHLLERGSNKKNFKPRTQDLYYSPSHHLHTLTSMVLIFKPSKTNTQLQDNDFHRQQHTKE